MKLISYTYNKSEIVKMYNDFCVDFAISALTTKDEKQIEWATRQLNSIIITDPIYPSLERIALVICQDEPFLDFLFNQEEMADVSDLLIINDVGATIEKVWVCNKNYNR